MKRERRQPVRYDQAAKRLKATRERPRCLHPSAREACSDRGIKAHSLSRRANGLDRLSNKGHVYGFVIENSGIVAKEIGVGKASTFPGFCATHDNELFRPIESEPVVPTPEQAFLLAYRGVSKELHEKQRAHDGVSRLGDLDSGRGLSEQVVWQATRSDSLDGAAMGIKDLESLKAAMDSILQRATWSEWSCVAVEFNHSPDILVAGTANPEWDFQGEQLREISLDDRQRLPLFALSVVPSEAGGTLCLLGWLETDEASRNLAMSMLRLAVNELANAMVRLAFEFFENVFARIDWWDELPAKLRDALLRRSSAGLPDSPDHAPDCLCEDGFAYVKWGPGQVLHGENL